MLFFGPLPQGLLDVVQDETWCELLKDISFNAEDLVAEYPTVRLEKWNLNAETKSLISALTQLGPEARPRMEAALSHHWWSNQHHSALGGGSDGAPSKGLE